MEAFEVLSQFVRWLEVALLFVFGIIPGADFEGTIVMPHFSMGIGLTTLTGLLRSPSELKMVMICKRPRGSFNIMGFKF